MEAGAGVVPPVAGDCLSGTGAAVTATLPVSFDIVSGVAGVGVKVIVGALDCSMGATATASVAISSGGTHVAALVTAPSLGEASSGGTHPAAAGGAAGSSLDGLACSSSGGTQTIGYRLMKVCPFQLTVAPDGTLA